MIQIVATPGSGDGCAQATAERIERALAARGQPARLELFHGLRRLSRWSASCRAGFSHLICVGGDATMSASATAAIRHRVPLLPVPSGFGNLFARTFGHTDDVPAVLRTLDASRVVWVDAGARHGEIFLSHESFGMLDEIQDEVEHGRGQPRSRVLRLLAYYRMGLRFLGRALPSSIRVEVDGALVARRAALVTIANVQAYGAFLTLTPDASPTDGLLDVFVIPRTTKLRVWGRLLKVLLHVPPRGDEVLIRRGRRVSVGMPGRRMEEIRVMPAVLPVLVAPDWHERFEPTAAPEGERGHVAGTSSLSDRRAPSAGARRPGAHHDEQADARPDPYRLTGTPH